MNEEDDGGGGGDIGLIFMQNMHGVYPGSGVSSRLGR